MGWVCEYPPFLYMKQHITKRQWDELSFEQRNTFCIKTKYVGEITIGQMIEFLGDDWLDYNEVDCADHGHPPVPHLNKDLCNKLWEACKYKLK